MIGLGGGSIATFIHRNLPDARIRVVELNREVIAVARSMFGLPQDDARLTVEAGDGALFVASAAERADVLMVDGFNRLAQVHALATRRFYERAVSNLRSGGMLVVNLLQDDSGLDAYLKRIEAACRGGTLCLEAKGEPNLIVFGFRDPVPTLRWDVLKARALQLERATGMRFGSFLQGLRRLNPSTQTYLKPSRGGLL